MMLDTHKVAKVLLENYSLSEMEEMGITPLDLEEGIYHYVEENLEVVVEQLKKDLWEV